MPESYSARLWAWRIVFTMGPGSVYAYLEVLERSGLGRDARAFSAANRVLEPFPTYGLLEEIVSKGLNTGYHIMKCIEGCCISAGKFVIPNTDVYCR